MAGFGHENRWYTFLVQNLRLVACCWSNSFHGASSWIKVLRFDFPYNCKFVYCTSWVVDIPRQAGSRRFAIFNFDASFMSIAMLMIEANAWQESLLVHAKMAYKLSACKYCRALELLEQICGPHSQHSCHLVQIVSQVTNCSVTWKRIWCAVSEWVAQR